MSEDKDKELKKKELDERQKQVIQRVLSQARQNNDSIDPVCWNPFLVAIAETRINGLRNAIREQIRGKGNRYVQEAKYYKKKLQDKITRLSPEQVEAIEKRIRKEEEEKYKKKIEKLLKKTADTDVDTSIEEPPRQKRKYIKCGAGKSGQCRRKKQ